MSHSADHLSNDSNMPFVDPERPFKMKWSTLKAIITLIVLGVAGGVAWSVSIAQSIKSQAERSERIEVKMKSVEVSVDRQTEAIYEQKTKLLLMDQKLDNIARQTR